jgi:GPH family glycoside/pentoside/hexuronide:cation symporter
VGQALAAAGFLATTPGEPPPVQPDSALQAIRLAIGPMPAICLTIGLVLAWLYPITKARHGEIMERLRAKLAGSESPQRGDSVL